MVAHVLPVCFLPILNQFKSGGRISRISFKDTHKQGWFWYCHGPCCSVRAQFSEALWGLRPPLLNTSSQSQTKNLTTAVLYNGTKVALAQAYELICCSHADRPDDKCTINMGQSYVGGLDCTLAALWQAQGKEEQAGGKENMRMIWLVLEHRISRTVWKRIW